MYHQRHDISYDIITFIIVFICDRVYNNDILLF